MVYVISDHYICISIYTHYVIPPRSHNYTHQPITNILTQKGVLPTRLRDSKAWHGDPATYVLGMVSDWKMEFWTLNTRTYCRGLDAFTNMLWPHISSTALV